MLLLVQEQDNIRTLLGYKASFYLLQHLYPEAPVNYLRKFLRQMNLKSAKVRQKWDSPSWHTEHTRLLAIGHVNAIVTTYEMYRVIALHDEDLNMQDSWRHAVIQTIDHYLTYTMEPVFSTADGVYSVIHAHGNQRTMSLVCASCKQTFWSFTERGKCPFCAPPLYRTCRTCGQPFLGNLSGRPTQYCSDRCRNEWRVRRRRTLIAI